MATKTFTITYPDAAAPRIMAALKSHYGKVEDPVGSGTMRDRTNAEVFAEFEKMMRDTLRGIVLQQEKQGAKIAAEAAVTEIPVT